MVCNDANQNLAAQAKAPELTQSVCKFCSKHFSYELKRKQRQFCCQKCNHDYWNKCRAERNKAKKIEANKRKIEGLGHDITPTLL